MATQTAKATDASPDPTQRDLFAWSLLAGLLLIGALAGPFFAGRVYTRDDLGAFHIPTRAFYARQLAQGEAFDWMPQLYSGFDLTGEGQTGTYHPLHLLLYRWLPLRAALAWDFLLPYPLMLAGMWLFLRRRLKRRDAAMFGSLVFTFSSFNLLHFLHPNAIAVVAHIPWLLWAIDVVLLDGRRRKVAWAQAAIALLTGSQLLLGYPQYVWFSLLTETAYVAFVLIVYPAYPRATGKEPDRRAADRERVGRIGSPWGPLVIAKGTGLLLGAVQLLPTIDALQQSTRHGADGSIAFWNSLPPLDLTQLIAPYMLSDRVVGNNTHEAGLYAGAVPLMLVVWLWGRQTELAAAGRLARAAAVFGVLAMLLAFGRYGGIYYLQTFLPVVGNFRCPCRYLLLFQLAMAVIASVGFMLLVQDCQLSHGRRGEAPPGPGVSRVATIRRRLRALWAVVAAGIAAALVGLIFHRQPWTASVPAILAGPLLLASAAGLVAWAARGHRTALVGLILLAAIDLGVYGLTYAVYPGTLRLDQYVAGVVTPPDADGGRVMASPLPLQERRRRTGNQITLAGWARADGYAGLEPFRNLDYRQLPALRTAGVRWLGPGQAADEIAGLVRRDAYWQEVPRPLPRARLVSRARPSNNPARDLPQIDVETTALTEFPLALPEAVAGTAELLADRPGHLHIRCDCTTAQLLVISESYHPGWQAIVDRNRQRVLRVNGDFLGCLVGPGRHEVTLEFRPSSLYRGRIVSCLGLGLVLICLAGGQVVPVRRPLEDQQR